MNFADFHFLRPYWLLALMPLAGYVYALHHRRLKQGSWAEVCDPQLLDWLLVDKPVKRRSYTLSWIVLGGIIAILSVAGPSWEKLPVPVFRNQSALVIVLDLSESMYANDLKPNRIAHARFKIIDILKQRKDGHSALIAYSDAAFVVTPLSSDAETIIHQLNVLEPNLMPGKGNDTKAGLKKAAKLLKQANVRNGQVLLVTDGGDDNQSKVKKAAKRLAKQGHQLFILGVGTEAGAPIPQPGGFLLDEKGSILIPQLDQSALKAIAEAGHGVYRTNRSGDTDIKQLLDAIDKSAKTDVSEKAISEISRWKDQGPWLVLLLLPFVAMIFRKGYFIIVLGVMIGISPDSYALGWNDLWYNADQRGQQAFNKKKYDAAAKNFNSPHWKAASQYRAGNHDKAAEILKKLSPTSENLYNLGNAQARQNQLEDALKSYQQALKENPQHEDAQYNKQIVEQALKEQQKQQQDQNQESDDQSDTQDQQDQQQSDDQSDDSQQQQKDQQQNDNSSQQEQQKQQESSSNNDSQEQDENEEQAEQQNKAESADNEEDKGQQTESQAAKPGDEKPLDELDQATEQWLRRIPDDPGRLLRRKFQYQYNRQNQ
jgi:Ca-activated chloride channel family protein